MALRRSASNHDLVLAGPPSTAGAVPPALAAWVAGRRTRLVWVNERGGLTFEVGAGAGRCFAKWAPAASGIDLSAEQTRLAWASAFTPVPRVLAGGADDLGSWMATGALPGQSAVSVRWRANPTRAVPALGEGLRALHDALPVPACPFSWQNAQRVEQVHPRAAAGQLDPARWPRPTGRWQCRRRWTCWPTHRPLTG